MGPNLEELEPSGSALLEANLREAEDAEFQTKPIDRSVDASTLPHYLAFRAVKSIIATQCMFIVYCFRCAQELATARTIEKHPHTWKARLTQYRTATSSRGQMFIRPKADSAPAMRIGFVGCGVVGRTIAESLLDAGLTHAGDMLISTRTTSRVSDLSHQGVYTTFDNAAVASDVNILFVCVLPPHLPAIANELRESIRPFTLVVVLASTLTTAKMLALFPRVPVLHASSVDVVRLRDELHIDAAARARISARRATEAAALAAQVDHAVDQEIRSAAHAAAAAEASAAAVALASRGEPALSSLPLQPAYFLKGQAHIVGLAASHATESWCTALTAALHVAVHGLELEADERRLVCLKAALGAQMHGDSIMQSLQLLESQGPIRVADHTQAQIAAARREQADATNTTAARVFSAGVRENLVAVLSQLHASQDAAGADADHPSGRGGDRQ